MKKLKLISEVRVDGKWLTVEEVGEEFFRDLIRQRSDYAMANQGYVRKDKTA